MVMIQWCIMIHKHIDYYSIYIKISSIYSPFIFFMVIVVQLSNLGIFMISICNYNMLTKLYNYINIHTHIVCTPNTWCVYQLYCNYPYTNEFMTWSHFPSFKYPSISSFRRTRSYRVARSSANSKFIIASITSLPRNFPQDGMFITKCFKFGINSCDVWTPNFETTELRNKKQPAQLNGIQTWHLQTYWTE